MATWQNFTSEKAWGEDGYLAEKGMIPMPAALRTSIGADVINQKPMTADGL